MVRPAGGGNPLLIQQGDAQLIHQSLIVTCVVQKFCCLQLRRRRATICKHQHWRR